MVCVEVVDRERNNSPNAQSLQCCEPERGEEKANQNLNDSIPAITPSERLNHVDKIV